VCSLSFDGADQTGAPDSAAEPADEQISVQVDEVFAAEVNPADLARAALLALQNVDMPGSEVTVVVTGDDEVRTLNRQFRGVDAPTDVLSFPAQESAAGFVSAPEASNYLGDVVIALPFTARQAVEVRHPLADELRLLVVHGVLHLAGYDHAEPDDEAAMWARQDTILARLELP
jgi:probable rRNA maturation factor